VARRGFSGVVYRRPNNIKTYGRTGGFELQSVVLYVPTQIDP